MKKQRTFFLSISLVFLLAVSFYYRLKYASPFASTWDKVDFSLALERFDLLLMQPHFPGYPYFVLGGMAVNQVVGNTTIALSILNVILTATSLFPMYWISRRFTTIEKSIFIVFVVHSLSYTWVMGTEPMSEMAGVSLLWWYFWSLLKAKESKTIVYSFLPLLLFSFVLGIRLSYLPFAVGIILLWIYEWRNYHNKKYYVIDLIIKMFFAMLCQLLWVTALVINQGGLINFLELAFGFTGGHFSEWGGTVSSESGQLWKRFVVLLFNNFIWVGLTGKSVISLVLLGAFLFIGNPFSGIHWKNLSIKVWFCLMGIAYFFWALFAQNIDKPRHILPLVGLFFFLIVMQVIKKKRFRFISVSILVLFSLIQSWHGYELIKEKATEAPSTYQIVNYLNQIEDPLIVYTWEETRIMEYLDVPFLHKEIFTYSYFQEDLDHYQGRKVFLTDKVLQGFETQGIDIKGKVKKIKAFHSNPLFDPVYDKVILYEWIG